MTGPVTVIGLVQGGVVLEDIRTTVPQRMAIQIPAHLAERSRSLADALQQRQIMRLGGPTVVNEVPAPLSPSLRGRGIPPQGPTAVTRAERPQLVSAAERELLVLELEASREECRRLQGLNEALHGTLQLMGQQLSQIQATLDALVMRRTDVLPTSHGLNASDLVPSKNDLVPHFIPRTTLGAAEVRINAAETASVSKVDEAVAALRSLRGKSA